MHTQVKSIHSRLENDQVKRLTNANTSHRDNLDKARVDIEARAYWLLLLDRWCALLYRLLPYRDCRDLWC